MATFGAEPVPKEVAAALTESVLQDQRLVNKARDLADKAIDTANYLLDEGSPALQIQVIKSLMPAIGRGMQRTGEDETIQILRTQMQELMDQIMEMTPDAKVIELHGDTG